MQLGSNLNQGGGSLSPPPNQHVIITQIEGDFCFAVPHARLYPSLKSDILLPFTLDMGPGTIEIAVGEVVIKAECVTEHKLNYNPPSWLVFKDAYVSIKGKTATITSKH